MRPRKGKETGDFHMLPVTFDDKGSYFYPEQHVNVLSLLSINSTKIYMQGKFLSVLSFTTFDH